MNIDPAESAALVTREVWSAERQGRRTRVIVASRVYDTDQPDLWDALTNPDRLPRWFAPVSGTLRKGGRYQVEGNASGLIETCLQPDSFSLTWEAGGSTSWLVVTLRPAGDATELELVHESLVLPTFWKQYGPGATGLGWEISLLFLAQHLVTRDTLGPKSEHEFCASEAGQIFLGAAAAGWADAAIADGDDPGEAHQAAEASAAFYTPAPE